MIEHTHAPYVGDGTSTIVPLPFYHRLFPTAAVMHRGRRWPWRPERPAGFLHQTGVQSVIYPTLSPHILDLCRRRVDM